MTPAPKPPSRTLHGIPVSPGIHITSVFLYDPVHAVIPRRTVAKGGVEQEKRALSKALEEARAALLETRNKVRENLDESHAAIFDPQLMILDDPVVIASTHERIEECQENAARAFMTVIKQFVEQFAAFDVQYLASRATDILDVGNRVCRHLAGDESGEGEAGRFKLDSEVIVLARDLSPSETAHLGQRYLRGLATELGGHTSHTAILAKALEFPAVVGIGSFLTGIRPGTQAIIDGFAGTLTLDPSSREAARARQRRKKHQVHDRDLEKLKDLPAETLDGYHIDLAANLELPIEIPHVLAHGADGIGLFRTEFHYLETNRLPTEEELFDVYKNVVCRLAPQSVIFRTIDLGGDKFASTLQTEREINPFLGMRAIRLCLAHPDVFRTQLRAILRASAHGTARIMFPMISSLQEVREARQILEAVQEELRAEGQAFDEKIQVGIMIEIPAAVITADQLAKEVDFFSIGTNDLIQYTLAVDRGNEEVAPLYDPFHPAILRLIRMTVDAAQREGIWCGLCGEMSANPLCALLLVGMGMDELSMGALAIPEIKRVIRQVKLSETRRLVEEIYTMRTSREIHEHVRNAYRSIQCRRMRSAAAARA